MPNLTISDIRRTMGIYSTQPITIINGGAVSVQTVASSGVINFDISAGNWGSLDIATNVSPFNFTNISAGSNGLIYVFQTTGGHDITWGTMVNEVPASGISLLTGAGEMTIIGWSSVDGVTVDVYVVGTGSGVGGTVAWSDVTGKPSTFAPSAHAHPISDVTGLQAALDGKSATSHTHTRAQITDFAHTHVIGDTTGLQAALDAKQATLVSGTNVKTINGQSILGSGDLSVGATNKVTLSVSSNTSYNYPSGAMITRVVVVTTSALAAFRIGTTPNGEELFPDTPLDASSSTVVAINYYAALAGTIYFSGITSSTTLILYYE